MAFQLVWHILCQWSYKSTNVTERPHLNITSHIFWHSIWHSLSHSMRNSTSHLFWHPSWHSMWHLALAKRSRSAYWHLALAVGVRQCLIWRSLLRSGMAHWDLELAVEARQCPLRSAARGWGPAVPHEIWPSRWRIMACRMICNQQKNRVEHDKTG